MNITQFVFSEFQLVLGLKESLYLDRFFQLFDDNNDGFINFEEFVLGLSILSSKGTHDEKMECKLILSIFQRTLMNFYSPFTLLASSSFSWYFHCYSFLQNLWFRWWWQDMSWRTNENVRCQFNREWTGFNCCAHGSTSSKDIFRCLNNTNYTSIS